MPDFHAEYGGAFMVRCLQCDSVYLIGITERNTATSNICLMFEDDYKCPGRLVSLDERIENIDSFREILDLLQSAMEGVKVHG